MKSRDPFILRCRFVCFRFIIEVAILLSTAHKPKFYFHAQNVLGVQIHLLIKDCCLAKWGIVSIPVAGKNGTLFPGFGAKVRKQLAPFLSSVETITCSQQTKSTGTEKVFISSLPKALTCTAQGQSLEVKRMATRKYQTTVPVKTNYKKSVFQLHKRPQLLV